ncbi:hypothetical protein [Halochromatium sp.]
MNAPPRPPETLTLEIDPSLLEHVRKRLAQRRVQPDTQPEEIVSALVTTILDNSGYPIHASRTDTGQIRIRYRMRSFSEPIL